MKLINPTLITINNTLHIKADNLEHVEVDSGSAYKIDIIMRNKTTLSANNYEYQLLKGIPLPQELSDRIEVRNCTKYINTESYSVPVVCKRAFLLPAKEDNIHFDKEQNKIYQFENANLSKLYTIEEIELAIDSAISIINIQKNFSTNNKMELKRKIINNLKK